MLLVYTTIYVMPCLTGRATRAILFVTFVLIVDMLVMSIGFDFAGLPFHIFEEVAEAVAGAYFIVVAAPQPVHEPTSDT